MMPSVSVWVGVHFGRVKCRQKLFHFTFIKNKGSKKIRIIMTEENIYTENNQVPPWSCSIHKHAAKGERFGLTLCSSLPPFWPSETLPCWRNISGWLQPPSFLLPEDSRSPDPAGNKKSWDVSSQAFHQNSVLRSGILEVFSWGGQVVYLDRFSCELIQVIVSHHKCNQDSDEQIKLKAEQSSCRRTAWQELRCVYL